MELAIVGLVGLLGYAASATGKDARDTSDTTPQSAALLHPQAYPFGPGTDVQKTRDDDRRATQTQWEQSLQPHVTGVISPNTKPSATMPFFSSEAKQGTNDGMKQRRMEMFTGALDSDTSATGTYRHKKEAPSFFDPKMSAVKITSGGTGGSAAVGIDSAGRYVPSLLQQNVVPTQQVRVGPGVGVGADVTAADGFHPMLRIRPDDFGWKKNNLPGGFVPGGSAIPARPSETPAFTDFAPQKFWDLERRPLGPGRATLTMPTARSPHPGTGCSGHSRTVGDVYYGGAAAEGSYTASSAPTRDRGDNNPGMPQTNVTGARDGVGGFVNAVSAYDMTRVATQQREATGSPQTGAVTGARAPAAQRAYLLPDTHRSMQTGPVSGNPGSAVEGGQARPFDRADRTVREQLHGQALPGVATPYIKGASVTGTHKWLDRQAKRHDQIIQGWLPPPCMASAVASRGGAVAATTRAAPSGAVPLPTTSTPLGMAPPGQPTGTYNKLPSENTRLDLSLATTQLADNEVAVSVLGRPR